jgi:hypothetical protein
VDTAKRVLEGDQVLNESVNYWKLATIGILVVGASVGATLMITGQDSKTGQPESPAAQVELTPSAGAGEKASSAPPPARGAQPNRKASADVPPPSPPAAYRGQAAQPASPSPSVMQACNQYANEQVNSKTEEVLKNAALGAAIGAAVGAAGGAIAGGGSGAGKGAAIGGVTGAAGGTLYGLNETKSHDAEYREAYAFCMHSKGY